MRFVCVVYVFSYASCLCLRMGCECVVYVFLKKCRMGSVCVLYVFSCVCVFAYENSMWPHMKKCMCDRISVV